MAMELDIPLVSAVLLSLYLLVSLIKNNLRRGGPLPPGPSGLPILGNALDMSGAHPWIKYTEWSRQYGLSLPIRTVIVSFLPYVRQGTSFTSVLLASPSSSSARARRFTIFLNNAAPSTLIDRVWL